MIGSINSFAPSQNNSTAFGSMYGVGRYWNNKFPVQKETEALTGLLSDLKQKNIKLKSQDSITSHFECENQDIFFTREKEHMMANIKCVSKNDEDAGFYLINDSSDSVVKNLFDFVSSAFEKMSNKSAYHSDILRTKSKSSGYMINFKK